MIESAGLLIIQNNKILLAHPTNAPWYGSYTIPKGKVEKNETYIQTAIRETKEEVGIEINISDVDNTINFIDYTDENNKVYKRVFYFLVKLDKNIEIDKNKIDKNEVDWAGFIDKDEALSRIFWRFEEMLKYLD